jgi:hypothetical protein
VPDALRVLSVYLNHVFRRRARFVRLTLLLLSTRQKLTETQSCSCSASGEYNVNTPHKPTSHKPIARTTQRNTTRPVAGPSKLSNGSGKLTKSDSSTRGGTEIDVLSDEDVVEVAGQAPKAQIKKANAKPAASAVAKTNAKGKWKIGGENGNRSNKPKDTDVDVDGDMIMKEGTSDDLQPKRRVIPPLSKDTLASRSKPADASERELERLRKENADVRVSYIYPFISSTYRPLWQLRQEVERWDKKCEEILRLRITEPEQALRDQAANYEARLQSWWSPLPGLLRS